MQVVWKSEESSTEVVYSADLRMDVPRWASANGAGTFTRTGGLAAGVIEAETTDQLLDADICANAALSGSTTLVSSRHTAVITYDGLTDCDPDQAAPWSMDGADRGVIEHIGCSAGGRTGGGLASAFVLLLAAALVSRPRRC